MTIDLNKLNSENKSFAAKVLDENLLHYPSEYVVRFLASNRKKQNQLPSEGLDIGFGSGQHLSLLMDFGYRASGTELVETACDRVNQIYRDRPLLGDIITGDFREADLGENRFDVIICWGVAFLRPLLEIQTDLDKMFHLLKPGGTICINFRTEENWFYGLGAQLSDKHFLLDERAGTYEGAHYTFLDEKTTRQLVTNAGFEIKNFERWDWWKKEMKEHHSWWITWASKASYS